MRYVRRLDLDHAVQADLDSRQAGADRQQGAGTLNVTAEWKHARQTLGLKSVLATLQRMMGERQRCMYCLDSHGTDIEHFWPKEPFPARMFVWPNLLLCCPECGRFKGDTFPLANGQPLLIDPTAENPWLHLDFDPLTGNIVARFQAARNEYSEKGTNTVELLHLDGREALAAGYQRTFRRLARLLSDALAQAQPQADALIQSLRETDDHGLLSWCFHGSGQGEPPFRDLRDQQPGIWGQCLVAFEEG
jgi:uncharacterized protein (TIGR02646 family)